MKKQFEILRDRSYDTSDKLAFEKQLHLINAMLNTRKKQVVEKLHGEQIELENLLEIKKQL